MSDWQAIARNSSESALVQIVGSNFVKEAVYAAQAELARRAELDSRTFLTEWRKEMADGKRTSLTFDKLWRMACEEMRDAEFLSATAPRNRPASSDRYWEEITMDDVRGI